MFTFADFPTVGKQNPLSRAAGVELEIAGFHKPTRANLRRIYEQCEKWNAAIGTDGSIGTETGIEIRTSPAAGIALVQQLSDICGAMKVAGAWVNSGCGLHVHVDVRDIVSIRPNVPIFERILAAVTAAQPQLWQIVANVRISSHYCRPLPRSLTWSQALSIDRYYALNTRSIAQHGTLEFRLHHGSASKRVITAWTLLCVAMIDSAVRMADSTPDEITTLVSTNPAHWLESIAPTRYAKQYVGLRQRREKYKKAA